MKCVKCGKQKGKRACPALGGDICSVCCGTHRLKEISCPADCQYLGGLAVAAGLKEPPPDEVRAAAIEINEAITFWMRTYANRQWFADVALDEVFGDDDPDEGEQEWMIELFMAGMHHGVVDEKGRRAVDVMIAEKARELPPAQVAVLRSLSKSWFSVFRVERGRDDGRRDVDRSRLSARATRQRRAWRPLRAPRPRARSWCASGLAASPFPDRPSRERA